MREAEKRERRAYRDKVGRFMRAGTDEEAEFYLGQIVLIYDNRFLRDIKFDESALRARREKLLDVQKGKLEGYLR